MVYEIPPSPVNLPPYPDYKQGDSCPVCHGPVDYVQHEAPRKVGSDLVIGGGRAVLFACGHTVGRVLPPGDRRTGGLVNL